LTTEPLRSRRDHRCLSTVIAARTASGLSFLNRIAKRNGRAIHPKAMPVILTTEEERTVWVRAPVMKQRRCSARCRMTR
jgi:hypothetical protein